MNEFALIERYFKRPTPSAVLGIGDDAALIAPRPGYHLAIAADMLVVGHHFLPTVEPQTLGHKALAVNLSDLAAMGANPRWALLSIALPHIDEPWLADWTAGFFALAERYQVELIGGDTTRGPLNLSLQVIGEVPIGAGLRRSGAKPGDTIWVSGELGDAALAVAEQQGKIVLDNEQRTACLRRLQEPEPRVSLGLALQRENLATAAIDISDGLVGDLGHILTASSVGACIEIEQIPRSQVLQALFDEIPSKTRPPKDQDIFTLLSQCLLAGGDDYELCFTAPPHIESDLVALSAELALPLTKIGTVTEALGLRAIQADSTFAPLPTSSFDHFGTMPQPSLSSKQD